MTEHDALAVYTSLPKVDLHRHLEGSVRLRTLLEIGRTHGVPLPNTGRLRELVQVGGEDDLTFENFLSKFQTLRLFYRSPEAIYRITQETISDAAADNIRYMELRFTPIALSRAENFPLNDVIGWVVEAAEKASAAHQMTTRLIVSVNRQEGPEIAEKVIQVASDYQSRGIVGVDLAGNEANFSGLAFLGVFKEARQAGFRITIHAGEWGGAENVMNAILYLGAERIGHGVRVVEDPDAVTLARERGVPFEVCLTSNYQSGVVPTNNIHPVARMINSGLITTINTDDPSVSQITLANEYQLFCEDLELPFSMLRQCVINSAQAAFLPENQKRNLVQEITTDFPQTL